MKRLKSFYFSFIIILFFSFLFQCTYKNPLDTVQNIPNSKNESFTGLFKLPASETYLSSKADLQILYSKPGFDWKLNDLTEGRSIVSLYSPKNLVGSPAEDLLPRFTIVEMVFKDIKERTAKGMATYRKNQLIGKYGETNVIIIKLEDSIISDFPCIHFTYEVKYPVSGKHAITDEYAFYYNNNYYMIQFSKSADDINYNTIEETFKNILNNLKITKSLIS